jgi:hypothetical protein
LDRPRACERAARRASEAKPPPPFLKKSLRWPRQGRPRDGPSRGERSESIPPHRHILRRARTQVRAFFACGTRRGMRTPTGVRQLAQPPGQNEKTNLMKLSHFTLQGLVKQK